MSNRRVKDDNEITKKVVQYIDDPKNSSALKMVHEMSNRAKRSGNSPAILYHHRMRVDNAEPNYNKINNNNDTAFKRRPLHSLTSKNQIYNDIIDNKNEDDKDVLPEQGKKRGLRYSERIPSSNYKKEYAWDKNANRIVEKTVPSNTNTYKHEEKTIKQERKPIYQSKPQEKKVERVVERKIETRPKVQERKVERVTQPKVQERKVERVTQQKVQERKAEPQPKTQYSKNTGFEEIKEDKEKEEKAEIFEKLKEYRVKENKEGKKKKVRTTGPKGNEKYTEYVYEKNVDDEEDEFDDEDFEKELPGKNTKFYKKIVKNEPGSKVIITKKVIEESSSSNKDDKLYFENDSDDEDIKKELKKLKINPSECKRGNVQVKVITEEYDEKGNKIYSKQYTTSKLPKGLKGHNELMDEFEHFEDEYDE